jgi:hypothetical protein
MDLTQEEIERYTPYDTMAKFAEGFADYTAGRKLKKWPGVFGRAYNRGADCAMRRQLSLIGEISLVPDHAAVGGSSSSRIGEPLDS